MSEQDSACRTYTFEDWLQSDGYISPDDPNPVMTTCRAAWNAAVEAERARCLQIVDGYVYTTFHTQDGACAASIASAIRNRFRLLGVPTEASSVPVHPQEHEEAPKRRLTRNAARCKACGDVIESKHRHDFVTCSCGNLSVDGGLDYSRRVFKGTEDSLEDMNEYRPLTVEEEAEEDED